MYLEHVEHAEVLETPLLGVVHFGPLDDHRVRWEVHTPRQRSRAHQNLFAPRGHKAMNSNKHTRKNGNRIGHIFGIGWGAGEREVACCCC